jgi:hypothetical protein
VDEVILEVTCPPIIFRSLRRSKPVFL